MAEQTSLKAEARTLMGTRNARRLRAKGIVPLTLNAKGAVSLHLQASEREIVKMLRSHARILELAHGAGTESVFLKTVQYDHLGEKIYHIDFNKVAMDEKLELEVALVLKGKPVGVVDDGGVLDHYVKSVQIACLPNAIPEKIEVDVSDLKLNDNLTLGTITPPAGVELLQDKELVIAAVTEHKEEEVVVAEVEPGAGEPEVIEKEKTEEEGEEDKDKKDKDKDKDKKE